MFNKKVYFFYLYILIVSVSFLSSCSNKTNTLFYLKHKSKSNSSVQILSEGTQDTTESLYQKILPGDILSIRNLQNETQVLGYTAGGTGGASISSDYLVEPDSMVVLPFLNKVKLGGLYIPSAESFLNKSYSKNLLKEPLIKIKITNLKVTMMGEFGRVGNFPLSPNRTYLTDLIAEAGGLNPRANPKKIRIIRGNFKNPRVIQVNLQDIKSLANNNLFLRNNDIIYAETRNSYKFLDQISSTRNIFAIAVSGISAFILINRLNR